MDKTGDVQRREKCGQKTAAERSGLMRLYHTMTKEETAHALGTDIVQGLSEKEAGERLKKSGPNILRGQKKVSLVRLFLAQFQDFMILILLAASFVSMFTAYLDGSGDLTEALMILAIVVLNALMGVIQEAKAQKSIEALQKLAAPKARVIRGGKQLTIEAAEVVWGDLLLLKTGEIAAADCRLTEAVDLFADESALTGESETVEKSAELTAEEFVPTAERINMVYSSTEMTSGHGKGIVVGTGMDTEVGRIAGLLEDHEEEQTPLQKRLESAGKVMGICALVICALVFCVGVLRRLPVFDMFMTSVSLAVAAIPEGLAAIVTIMLAIGIQRMAKRGAIVRHLTSVETLGSATVICSDKTGTLTQNRMEVKKVEGGRDALELMCICSEEDMANPTEAALIRAAAAEGLEKRRLDCEHQRIGEVPFDSTRKRMTTLNKWGAGYRLITKGAVELLLPFCSFYIDNGVKRPLTDSGRREITRRTKAMAQKALRVIGVCYRDETGKSLKEEQMVFAGMAGIYDPPRKEAKEAVAQCRKAGIEVIMITGDHPETARAVAEEIGITEMGGRVMTGAELDRIPAEEFNERIRGCRVFARVTPEHKMAVVKARKAMGDVVAMTGDGVNDAPALKCADIGCSMGIAGTDVARSASDMVLTDDNFATIVEAVRQGRGIYDNIRKAVHFLLSSNIGEIITVFVSLAIGCPAPLLPIQLLWVNLVTDSLPAIALGLDPAAADVMDKKPRPANEGIFAGGLGSSIALEGCMIGLLSLIAFLLGLRFFGSTDAGRTMAFGTLSLSQLVHAFNMRSETSVLRSGIFKNKYLVGAFMLGALLQIAVMSIPSLQGMFKTVAMDMVQWGIVGLLSLMPILIVEGGKLFSESRKRR